jgi:hypothetical protein
MSSRKKSRKKRKTVNHRVSAGTHQRNGAIDDTGCLTPGKFQSTASGFADEINRLISKDKIKAAVSRAKIHHKRLATAESEMVLVDAYVARIREMMDRGFTVEAKTLLKLVRGRYNCPDHRLTELNAVISLREGRIDELVRPLENPGLPQEQRAAIEKIITNELVDLSLLARCETLPSGHPLKTAAKATAQAFARVTSGFVRDEEVALPTVSRRSPLAPWKILIRALASFYRHDDEICQKHLNAVDPESVPGRLVPLIRELIAGQSKVGLNKNQALLAEKVIGNNKTTREALQMLDAVLAANKPRKLFKAVRKAVDVCEQSCPEVLDRLKQHVSIRAWMLDVDAENVNRALGGPSLKNAYFWLLHARAADIKGKYLWACALLEEFRKHALYEGWFSEKSLEVSVIYLYMADLLGRLPTEDFEWLQSRFKREFTGFESYYHGQPESVSEALREDNPSAVDMYFLYPARLYRLASEIDPTADTFRQWLEWTENYTSHWKRSDAVATAWHTAIPDDTRPLLYLMKSAENRNAFKKALGYLEKAERLDGLNPDVKKARPRLLAATAIRHLKQKKTHLAQKDLIEIEALPQFGEGDRPAFLVALKSVCAVIDGQKSQLNRLNNELINLLESPVTAKVVMQGLLRVCGLSDRQINLPAHTKAPMTSDDLSIALAKGCQLGDDMGIPITIPLEYEKKLRNFFTAEDNSHDTATIRVIAETALRNKHFELAYAAAGVGLVKQGASTARFLLLRARSLPTWEIERKDDCLTAAIELARRERDLDLIDEAIELRRNGNRMPFGFSLFNSMIGEDKPSMDAEELNDVLELEKEAREYPSHYMSDDFFGDYDDDDDDDEESDCRYCDAKNCRDRKAPYRPDELYAEEFDDDDDIDEFPDFNTFLDDFLPDLPPGLMSLIMKVFSKHGRNGSFPDPAELTRKDPWLADQLLREISKAEADGTLPDFDRDWIPGWRSRNSKRNRR